MKMAVSVSIVIVVLSAVMGVGVRKGPSSSDEAEKELDWKTLIISDSEHERHLSQRMVLEDRQDTIQYLLSVLDRPVRQGEEFFVLNTGRNMAISLLGTLRAKESAGPLTEWLTPKPGQSATIDEESVFAPAGRALVEIGIPAVPPLVDLLRSENIKPFRREYIKIIVAIKGLRETELLFEDVIAAETDGAKKANLKAAQALLEDAKFREILENLDKQRTWR